MTRRCYLKQLDVVMHSFRKTHVRSVVAVNLFGKLSIVLHMLSLVTPLVTLF